MTYASTKYRHRRLDPLPELLSAGCDPDFDHDDGLDRQFEELRLQLSNSPSGARHELNF